MKKKSKPKPKMIKVGEFVKSKDNVKYEAFMDRGECFIVKEVNQEDKTVLITSKDGETTHVKIGYFSPAKKSVDVNRQIRNIKGGITRPNRHEVYLVKDIRCVDLKKGARAFAANVTHNATDYFVDVILLDKPDMEPIKIPSKCLEADRVGQWPDKERKAYDKLYAKYSGR